MITDIWCKDDDGIKHPLIYFSPRLFRIWYIFIMFSLTALWNIIRVKLSQIDFSVHIIKYWCIYVHFTKRRLIHWVEKNPVIPNNLRSCFSARKPCSFIQLWAYYGKYSLSKGLHSKNSRVRVRGGQTHFGVRPTRNPGQTDPESESDWPGIRVRKTFWTQIPVIFTRIPDQSDPGMGLAPWDPFPGQIWPGRF